MSAPSEPLDTAPSTGALSRLLVRVETHPVGVVWFGTVLFSTGPVMISAASVSGPVFLFWRLWIGTCLLATITVIRQRHTRARPSAMGVWLTVFAGAAFALHQLTLVIALRATSVVDVTLMNTLAPIVVALLAVPMFGERPGASFRAWSVVAIAGAALVALAGSSGPSGNPGGMALAASNVVFYSFFFVGSKKARAYIDVISFLFGVTVISTLLVSVYVHVVNDAVGDISIHDLLLCFAVAAFPGLIGHFSVTWSLKWVPANIPPVIMLSIPVLSGAMAYLFLGQGATWAKVIGGAITLVGVAGAINSPAARDLTAVEALDLAEEA